MTALAVDELYGDLIARLLSLHPLSSSEIGTLTASKNLTRDCEAF
jgi:hypothetical protein